MASTSSVRLHLILLAGGKGLRAATSSTDSPKQFQATACGPLYLVCLHEFLQLQNDAEFSLASLTVTIPDDWRDEVDLHLQELKQSAANPALEIPYGLASAGLTRTESTWSAIKSLLERDNAPQAHDLVAVQDAARPFASADLLKRLSAAALQDKAAVPGLPVSDSLIQVPAQTGNSADTGGYLDRSTIFAVQTPQVFQWDVFVKAHSWAAENGLSLTDDGSLLAKCGTMPLVVPGEVGNWKVTTALDSERAVEILSERKAR